MDSALRDERVKFQIVTAREKDPLRLQKKVEREPGKYANPLTDVTDLAGARVIVYYPSEVSKAVNVVEKTFLVTNRENIIGEKKESDPTNFVYCLPSMIVQLAPDQEKLSHLSSFAKMKCEVQLRTVMEHAWAEVEHELVYEGTKHVPAQIKRRFAELQAMVENIDQQFEALRRETASLPDMV